MYSDYQRGILSGTKESARILGWHWNRAIGKGDFNKAKVLAEMKTELEKYREALKETFRLENATKE